MVRRGGDRRPSLSERDARRGGHSPRLIRYRRFHRDQAAAPRFSAAEEGDFEALEALLAEDVELHGDGGGLAPAIRHPVFGRAKVVQLFRNWGRLGERIGGIDMRRVPINGQPGAEVLDSEGRLINVIALDIADGKIQAVRSIVNREKLRHLGPLTDTKELFERIRESH